jgi:hypothetical protein
VDSEISPELALVSPELAARARAALPDRPWEVFVPPPGAIERIGPAPAALTREHTWVERVSAVLPLVVLVGFVALLVVGSLPGLSQGPTLGPPGDTGVRSTIPTPSPGTVVPPNCPRPTRC